MKIILVANSVIRGGAEKQALLIYKYLSANHEVILLVKNKTLKKNNWLTWNIENLTYLLKIFILRFKSRDVDFILSIMPISHYAAIILKILFNANLVISIRNDLRYYKGALEDIHSFKFSILNYFANFYVVQNDISARLLRWKNVRRKIFVINNLLDIPQDNIKYLNNNIRSGIVFIQRLDWQKDPLYMIELIKKIDSRIKISVYGTGEYLKLFKKELKRFNNISINGSIDNTLLMKIIQQKLLGILTSFYEGMPNIIAEYILNGCFPVSTSNVYTNNLNQYKENNYILKGFDASIDAKNINKYYFELYSDKNKQRKIAKLNYDALLDFHNDKLNYSDWKDVFDSK